MEAKSCNNLKKAWALIALASETIQYFDLLAVSRLYYFNRH